MRDKLILLVGASGSGKTTIAKELEKEGYNIIHSYTTRKPREENEWGHTFIEGEWINKLFVTSSGDTVDDWDMIAYKELYDNHYFATKEQYQGKGTSIYIVDPNGAEQVHKNVEDVEVITIFLMVDDETRMWRMTGEGRESTDIRFRLSNDKDIFKTCKCDYVVDANGQLEDVLESIIEIIS